MKAILKITQEGKITNMGKRGVEPLRLAALEPKSSVSAISPLAHNRKGIHADRAQLIYHSFAPLSRQIDQDFFSEQPSGPVFCLRLFAISCYYIILYYVILLYYYVTFSGLARFRLLPDCVDFRRGTAQADYFLRGTGLTP